MICLLVAGLVTIKTHLPTLILLISRTVEACKTLDLNQGQDNDKIKELGLDTYTKMLEEAMLKPTMCDFVTKSMQKRSLRR